MQALAGKRSGHRDAHRDRGHIQASVGSMICEKPARHRNIKGLSSAASDCSSTASSSGRSRAIRDLVTQLAQNPDLAVGYGKARSVCSERQTVNHTIGKSEKSLTPLLENSIVLGEVKWQPPTHDILGHRTPSVSSLSSRSSARSSAVASTVSLASTVRDFFLEEKRSSQRRKKNAHTDWQTKAPRQHQSRTRESHGQLLNGLK
eukprot:gnl/MRDRNA2_/MRDRNA2_153297_c0_seq1.p1 gnl/MRDRNA2_/MRDRNA2_153297_c0~~gnl/MRDRNA2_/MRDRNA2_153297_c0_seq1.p1  ORF type:complete len:204 (-),score=27.72 gnl/MRDRNA2_/MRDRNA2_153297_c0_seq1:28-639(-)